jgi:hypothetical protein
MYLNGLIGGPPVFEHADLLTKRHSGQLALNLFILIFLLCKFLIYWENGIVLGNVRNSGEIVGNY